MDAQARDGRTAQIVSYFLWIVAGLSVLSLAVWAWRMDT